MSFRNPIETQFGWIFACKNGRGRYDGSQTKCNYQIKLSNQRQATPCPMLENERNFVNRRKLDWIIDCFSGEKFQNDESSLFVLQVLSKYVHKLGVSPLWSLTDVYGLDPDSLESIPTPVKSVILLYPMTKIVREAFRWFFPHFFHKFNLISVGGLQ